MLCWWSEKEEWTVYGDVCVAFGGFCHLSNRLVGWWSPLSVLSRGLEVHDEVDRRRSRHGAEARSHTQSFLQEGAHAARMQCE